MFFLLLGLFSFLEAKASLSVSFDVGNKAFSSVADPTEKISKSSSKTRLHHRCLPFFTAALLLIIFQISLVENLMQNAAFTACPLLVFIGGLLIVTGIVFRLKSIATLKEYFVSHIQLINDHQLVTKGVFSIVRHPSELGLLMIVSGVVILLESLSALVMTLGLFVPLTLYRIVLEDRLLHNNFKGAFVAFKRETPSLLPRLSGKIRWV